MSINPLESHHREGREAAQRRNRMDLGLRAPRRSLQSWIRPALPFLKNRWMAWGLMLGALLGLASRQPWTTTPELRNALAGRNCAWARAVGLAPARQGELGYWKHNDRDRDGIACEPWPPHHH